MRELLENVGNGVGYLKDWYHGLEQILNGWPDFFLSLAMVTTGTVAILVGIFGPRWLKLVMLAWMWFP